MLAESILKYGGHPLFLCRPGEPATDRYHGVLLGSWSDPDLLKAFFDRVDVATPEVEHVDVDALRPFASQLRPSLDCIETTQHRIREKQFLAKGGLPHAQFTAIASQQQANDFLQDGLPAPRIMKTALGGYDGLGQFRLETTQDLISAFKQVGSAIATVGVVLEEILDISAEASCVVVRDANRAVSFPIFDNVHRNHILDTTVVPSVLPQDVQDAMRRIARDAAERMNVLGVLTTEFFVTLTKPQGPAVQVGEHFVVVNEFAPRTHNSGHVSRNACTLSQFDLLARVLLDLPIVEPQLHEGEYCMSNLLSELWDNGTSLNLQALSAHPAAIDVVLYGKSPSRPGRKMGHLVATGPNALQRAIAAREAIRR